jgi:GWxTD domain-containing protein
MKLLESAVVAALSCAAFGASALTLMWPGPDVAAQRHPDWSASTEAAFLTRDELAVWKTLRSEEDHERFKVEYWQRRDPTPETERNEFKETILGRIRIADGRFALGKKPGSQTSRGLVFVVFGAPSVERQTMGPLKSSPDMMTPGKMGLPNEAFDTTEWHTWVYDRSTASELLNILERPLAEVSFIVEPGRTDRIQSSDIFQRWREKLARRSIVSPAKRDEPRETEIVPAPHHRVSARPGKTFSTIRPSLTTATPPTSTWRNPVLGTGPLS